MESTDVLVIGSGIAGLCAAIEAARTGATVAVASAGKTMSGSSFFPGTWGLGLIGPVNEDDEQDLIDTIQTVGGGVAGPELVQTFVHGIPQAIEWLEQDLGVELQRPQSAESAQQKQFIPCFDHKTRMWRGLTRKPLEDALNANKARKKPLRVILNGLGKDAAQIIARINGFTYVKTQFDYYTGELKVVETIPYSDGPRAAVNCYGSDDVREGVAIMWHENVDISITGNSTNPTRFQHPVAGTYKKERLEAGKKYFSVASGGGTGRTLHPDNMGAGPASYGMTDTMGRMHSDAQFAGSSSVPAHVDMMGLIGMGNNPMVGATVACAVAVEEALKA